MMEYDTIKICNEQIILLCSKRFFSVPLYMYVASGFVLSEGSWLAPRIVSLLQIVNKKCGLQGHTNAGEPYYYYYCNYHCFISFVWNGQVQMHWNG